jgi:hypothetical protein
MTGSEWLAVAKYGMSAIQILNFIREQIPNSDIISAHFDAEGKFLSGSDQIEVTRTDYNEDGSANADSNDGIWLYRVKDLPGYSFQRFPLVDSGITEQLGYDDDNDLGTTNADAEIWRWVPTPPPNTLVGGNYTPRNALVEFVIVGFKSSALLDHFSH